jgi:hypothetical protein
MRNNVTETLDTVPVNVSVCLSEILGQLRHHFADYNEVHQTGIENNRVIVKFISALNF